MPVLSPPPAAARLLASLAVLLGAGLLFADTPYRPAAGHDALTVIYVGAEDCGPCRAWRRNERPGFVASRVFARLHYREIVAPRLRDLLTERPWPADLAGLRERIGQRPGAPQWLVLRDGEVVAWESGQSAWRRTVWPAIRAHAGHASAPPRRQGG